MENYEILEKTYSITILINLSEKNINEKFPSREFMNKIGCKSNVTFDQRLEDLKKIGLIDIEFRPTVKEGKIIGGGKTKWIWITEKGKKVAKLLKEIVKVM